MTKYKNFYGTKEEYIENCIATVEFWAKVIIEARRTELKQSFIWALNNAEEALANEGWDWDDIEALEERVWDEAMIKTIVKHKTEV